MTQLHIDIAGQLLWLLTRGSPATGFMVSTAANGPGELNDSGCTPRGYHEIAEKIGADSAVNTVFRGRVASGEIYSEQSRQQQPDSDWILTRVLWLRGLEPGRNSGDGCDSYQRYIYIHGTPDDVPMGIPGSKGCIRMRNSDITRLFDIVATGDKVWLK